MREIRRVVVHHSASEFGDAAQIDVWHRQPPHNFRCIGYHFVILNGCRRPDKYVLDDDGELEVGRDISEVGAHVEGHNADTIGICLIGNDSFTRWQFVRLMWLLRKLNRAFAFGADNVFGHCELDPKKPLCPGFNMELLRAALVALDAGEEEE